MELDDDCFDWSESTMQAIWPPKHTWPDEERDLTPWVVGHLGELGDKLGIRLTLVDCEAPIGMFRADILAADDRGRKVIIENEFGPSDLTCDMVGVPKGGRLPDLRVLVSGRADLGTNAGP